MKTSTIITKIRRIGEISLLSFIGTSLLIFPMSERAAATAEAPVVSNEISAPTGLSIFTPWQIMDSTGLMWAYGVKSTTGTLISYNQQTGITKTFSQMSDETEVDSFAINQPSGILAYSVRRTGSPNRIVSLDSNTGARLMQYILPTAETGVRAMGLSDDGHFAFVAGTTSPLSIYRINTSTGNLNDSLTLGNGNNNATSMVKYGGNFYITTGTAPVRLLVIGQGTLSTPSTKTLNAETPNLIDPTVNGDIAYYGSEGTPGVITAVNLATKTVVGSLTLEQNENGARNLTINKTNGLLYLTTATAAGSRIVTIDTNRMSRVGQAELGTGFSARGLTLTGYKLHVTTTGTKMLRTLTVAPAPSSPLNPRVFETNRGLSVSWEAPASVEPISGYSVTATSETAPSVSCQTIQNFCSLENLVNGSVYSVRITANSLAGSSTAATLSGSPFTTPQAPKNPAASRGNQQIQASWEPNDLGGRDLIYYTATASPGGKFCQTTSTSCAIDGLTNGKSYTFSVTATTVAGISPTSSPSASVVPATNPDPISGLNINEFSHELLVEWQAPDNDGGLPILNYEVRDFETNETVCQTEALNCQIQSLPNGVPRKFVVFSKNEVGYGTGVESGFATPGSPPSIVKNLIAVPGNQIVYLSWTAPEDNGGFLPIAYEVYFSGGELACVTLNEFCEISELTNGLAYSFTVFATNERGTSVVSAESNLVTPTAPLPPIVDPVPDPTP